MRLSIGSTILALLIGVAAAATAQTPWPPNIAGMVAGDSANPHAAPIPPEPKSLPEPDASSLAGAWQGRWAGYACRGRSCDLKLTVEDVTEAGADVTLSLSSTTREQALRRSRGVFAQGELQLALQGAPVGASTVTLRLRSDGAMEFLHQGDPGSFWGVLHRVDRFFKATPAMPVNFIGTWDLSDRTDGRSWGRRVRLEAHGGRVYKLNRTAAVSAAVVCANLTTPVEELAVTGNYVTFVVQNARIVPGCTDERWMIEKRGDAFSGSVQGIDTSSRQPRGDFVAVKLAP